MSCEFVSVTFKYRTLVDVAHPALSQLLYLMDLCPELQLGEKVPCGGFQLELQPTELVEVTSGGEIVCSLRYHDLLNVRETLVSAKRTFEKLTSTAEVAFFDGRDSPIPVLRAVVPRSEFTGHAYMNLSDTEDLCGALSELEAFNENFDKRGDRVESFEDLPPPPPSFTPPSDESFHTASSDYFPAPPAEFSFKDSSAQEKSKEEQDEEVDALSKRFLRLRADQGAEDVGDDLPPEQEGTSQFPPESEDFRAFNSVSRLQEHLQGMCCFETLKYHPTAHGEKCFSCKVTFRLYDRIHEHVSDTRYSTKKEARQNAAYQACLSLNIFRKNTSWSAELETAAGIRLVTPSMLSSSPSNGVNWKNKLQELSQKSGGLIPTYDVSDIGNCHKHVFVAEVTVTLATGVIFTERSREFDNKKAAQFDAAETAFRRLQSQQHAQNKQPSGSGAAAATPIVLAPSPTLGGSPQTNTNWKNKLQELMQKNRLAVPVYKNQRMANGFQASVSIQLYDGARKVFQSETRSGLKAAEMSAAENAYRALQENNSGISEESRARDFWDWHISRLLPVPTFYITVTQRHPSMRFEAEVTFNKGSDKAKGKEGSSKKQAETNAIIAAIERLKILKLWDIS